MKISAWFAFVVALLAGLWWYLFDYDALPATSAFSVDWAKARELAGPGGPGSVHTERVAEGEFFEWMLFAGGGWTREPMEFRSYQLVYADGQTIMIDAVQDRALHESKPLAGTYHDAAWNHQLQALRQAGSIVVTHEHFDHIAGLRPLAGEPAVAARMYITRAQRDSGLIADSGFTPAELARLPAADYRGMHRLAPGVVLVEAPGHTPGNQIIYVRMKDGAEYAFIGDIVWSARNLLDRRAKGVLIGWLVGEDHTRLDPQIAWFAGQLPTSTVRLVIAHDPVWNAALIERGMLVEGFVLE